MREDDLFCEQAAPQGGRIVLLVLDGLGGLPGQPGGKTELESALTPNLDALAQRAWLGLSQPVAPGITVESGPGHLALFGYDPLRVRIGRGVLEAVGIGLELRPGDVAARGNFCTLDDNGLVSDRRAGRLPTEISEQLAQALSTPIEDVDVLIRVVREHRLAVHLRGEGLSAAVSGSDPQKNGHAPLPIQPLALEAQKTARVLNALSERARTLLAAGQPASPANGILLRGFDTTPAFPSLAERFKLKAAAIAVYPTYRGIASLAGMDVLPLAGRTHEDEFAALEQHWQAYDFFYLHIKETDLAGEDGDFDRKVAIIEAVDQLLPRLTALAPDVLVVTGDHATPAVLQGHSWHPVPVMIHSPSCPGDDSRTFGESACRHGSLGLLPAKHILPLAMAQAGRMMKWTG